MTTSNPTNEMANRYWLLIGDVPQGPFDVTKIHAKLAAGTATWQTPACRVGDATWLPLVNTPGLGPTSLPATAPSPTRNEHDEILTALPVDENKLPAPWSPASVSHSTDTSDQPTLVANPAIPEGKPSWGGIVVAILIIAFFGLVGYNALRSLTPREVCEKFDKARTAQEAKQFCTLNMHAAVDALHRSKSPVHNDPFEYTQESEAPSGVGGYFVGIRWQVAIPEERRRVQVDGVIHLINSDGWKIEDAYLLTVDRQPLPEPISMASNPDMLGGEQAGANPAAQAPRKQGSPQSSMTQAKAWYDNPGVHKAAGHGIARFLAGGGGKVIGVILIGIVVAIIRFGKELLEMFTSPSRQ